MPLWQISDWTTSRLKILYLHGFLSSPQSSKAQQTLEFCRQRGIAEQLHIPELDDSPLAAIDRLQKWIDQQESGSVALIGSSLGGYYATCLAERNHLRAALVNPAVRPHERWRDYIGQHRNFYSGRIHQVTEQHVEELQKIDHEPLLLPQNYLLLVQTGDEVLDYRLALDKYRGSACLVQEGGNHSFTNYPSLLPAILEFLQL